MRHGWPWTPAMRCCAAHGLNHTGPARTRRIYADGAGGGGASGTFPMRSRDRYPEDRLRADLGRDRKGRSTGASDSPTFARDRAGPRPSPSPSTSPRRGRTEERLRVDASGAEPPARVCRVNSPTAEYRAMRGEAADLLRGDARSFSRPARPIHGWWKTGTVRAAGVGGGPADMSMIKTDRCSAVSEHGVAMMAAPLREHAAHGGDELVARGPAHQRHARVSSAAQQVRVGGDSPAHGSRTTSRARLRLRP